MQPYFLQLIEALEKQLTESPLSENEKNYRLYLKLLYNSKQISKLISAAQCMHSIFTTHEPLEWIARVYIEQTFQPTEGIKYFIIFYYNVKQ